MKLIRHSPFKSKKLSFMSRIKSLCSSQTTASIGNYSVNATLFLIGKANGDADPLSRIQPETKRMFHDAIKEVCSACVISASNPCIETVLLTQNVNIDDSFFSDVDSYYKTLPLFICLYPYQANRIGI
jgi:hypothetical protein